LTVHAARMVEKEKAGIWVGKHEGKKTVKIQALMGVGGNVKTDLKQDGRILTALIWLRTDTSGRLT